MLPSPSPLKGRSSTTLAALCAACAVAMLLVTWGVRRQPTAAELLQQRAVRAPGDPGVGGHGIGGEVCWYEVNKDTGLREWKCPPPEGTLAAARWHGLQMLRVEVDNYGAAGCKYEFNDATKQGGWICPKKGELPTFTPPEPSDSYFTAVPQRAAQMHQHRRAATQRAAQMHQHRRARRPALFDFGAQAPAAGYAAAYEAPWGAAYDEDNMGALPPMNWGDNFDGKNFVQFYPEEQDFTGACLMCARCPYVQVSPIIRVL